MSSATLSTPRWPCSRPRSARAASPCVLFFDEIDALAPRRGGSDGNTSAERLVNQLLTEMDGLEPRRGVYVMGATNRPDMIDAALLRPGRFGKLLFVPLPTAEDRVSILRALTRNTPLHPEAMPAAVSILRQVGPSSGDGNGNGSEACGGWSGADVAAWVREACVCAIKERTASLECGGATDKHKASPAASTVLVRADHFRDAWELISPSVSSADARRYEQLRSKFDKSRKGR